MGGRRHTTPETPTCGERGRTDQDRRSAGRAAPGPPHRCLTRRSTMGTPGQRGDEARLFR